MEIGETQGSSEVLTWRGLPLQWETLSQRSLSRLEVTCPLKETGPTHALPYSVMGEGQPGAEAHGHPAGARWAEAGFQCGGGP